MNEKNEVLSCVAPMVLIGYREEHRPHNQNRVEGIIINPNLRPGFDMTDRDDRYPNEVRDWWNLPYIVTKAWSEIETAFEADRALLCARHSGYVTAQQKMESARRAAGADWFDKYPYGVRYEVRCLDGRIPDCTTVWGTEGTLRAAIRRAKAGPPWDRERSGTLNMNEFDITEDDVLADNVLESETSDLERQLARWIVKTTDVDVADAERLACEHWLAQKDIHRMLYDDFKAMWNSPAFELALRELRAGRDSTASCLSES